MGILDLLFPKTCLGCGKEGRYICENCIDKVKTPKPVCPGCLKSSIDGMTHSKCLRPWGLDGLTALWNYDGVIRKAILALKYKYHDEVAKELSNYALAAIKTYNSSFLVPASPAGRPNSYSLVPVPLYWYRKNWRGFNQTEEIGKVVAEGVGWKFIPDLLVRHELKVPQTALKRKERLQNVRGVFALNSSYALNPIPHTLVLFDDVWTTGSTLKEAAKVLKRAHVEKIWGLTLARGIS